MSEIVNDITPLLARAGLYRLLSLGLHYPKAESLQEVAQVQERFLEGEWPFEAIDRGLLALPTIASTEELEDEYLRLFDRKVACSPYESEYGVGNKAFTKSRDLTDIAGFYKAFGMVLADNAGELYDHVAVELEFMSVLALKEAYALSQGLEEEAEVCRDATKAFLRDHLGRWVPTFVEKLQEATEFPFYLVLANLLGALVTAELAHYDVQPLPLVWMPVGALVEDDVEAVSCPMAN